MPRTPARVTQADIARAIRAVQAAGVEGWVVTIKPDGTIVIGPGVVAETAKRGDNVADAAPRRARILL